MSQEIKEGQIVLCISSDFKMIATTSESKEEIGKQAETCPQIGCYYRVREILGDFLSLSGFSEYEWWHVSRFRAATLNDIEEIGLMNLVNSNEPI